MIRTLFLDKDSARERTSGPGDDATHYVRLPHSVLAAVKHSAKMDLV